MSLSQPAQQPALAEPTIDFRGYLGVLWRRKWAIAALLVLGVLGGFGYAKHQARGYTTSTQLYVQYPDPTTPVAMITFPGTSPQPPNPQQLTDITTLMLAPPIAETAYATLHLPVGSAGTVSAATLDTAAAANNGTSVIIVSATASSPTIASRLVNAYITAYLASRVSTEVAAADAAVQSENTELTHLGTSTQTAAQQTQVMTEIAQLKALAAHPSSGAHALGKAPVPTASDAESTGRDTVFGALLGLVLGIILAFCLEAFDRRLSRVRAFEDTYRLPVLAVIPHLSDPAPRVGAAAALPSRAQESVRSLRVNLWPTAEHPPRTILLVSAVAEEGRSSVARALALAYAEAGQRTLAIDADLLRPSLARLFGVTPRQTLEDVLQDTASLSDAAVAVPYTAVPAVAMNGQAVDPAAIEVDLLALLASPGAVGNPGALLASRAMQELLTTAREEYDAVIIDTSPLMVVSGAVPLLDMVDTTLVVARYDRTTRDVGRRFRELLEFAPRARVAGLVVTDARDVPFVDESYRTYDRGHGGRKLLVRR